MLRLIARLINLSAERRCGSAPGEVRLYPMALCFVKLVSKDGGEELYKAGIASSDMKSRLGYDQENCWAQQI